MKKKEEQSLKDLFKGEQIPEYDAKEAFENFEHKFPLNDSYVEESYKPKKKNRFKWLYWVPAVATALVVIPVSCIITSKINSTNRKDDFFNAYDYVKTKYDKVLSIENCYLKANDLKQEVFIFYGEYKGSSYFSAYAETSFSLKITLSEDNFNFSSTEFLFEKKLDNLDQFTYYLDFEGTSFDYNFNPKEYYNYFH